MTLFGRVASYFCRVETETITTNDTSRMKKEMITLLAILWTFSLANAQTVTLTFTGRDASSQHVQLNRVCVTNLTKGWQETIYWPDTTLSMQNNTGISENGLAKGFSLAQNVPNPFSGETEVFMATDETGDVFITISDVTGKSVAVFSRMMEPGGHHFRIRLADVQTYILTARQGARSASIKMVNKGTSEGNEILYEGRGNPISYTLKSSTTHPFTFGDQMEYVGYAVINGSEEESQRITQAQGSSQTFVMQFQGLQHRLPTVITSAVTEITENSALCGGTVTDEGSNAVTGRGVCWGTSHNPTINDSLTTEGSGIGSFTSNITELESSTTYYVRAYATNDVGTAYGQEIAFTTLTANRIVVSFDGMTWETSNLIAINHTNQGYITIIIEKTQGCSNDNSDIYIKGRIRSSVGTWNHGTTGDYLIYRDPSCIYTDYSGEYGEPLITYWNCQAEPSSFVENIIDLNMNTLKISGTLSTDVYSYMESLVYPHTEPLIITMENARWIWIPEVFTDSVSNITNGSAICGGNVTSEGGGLIARGVCWSSSQNPTTADNHTSNGIGSGEFTSTLTGLVNGASYYVRAYAISNERTVYGEQRKFVTVNPNDGQPCINEPTVVDIDNNSYSTVQIGNQCWMKENLRTTRYADGTIIPLDSTENYIVSCRYAPDNEIGNVAIYGYLYNWPAVMYGENSSNTNPSGVQGICPTGWHVPSDAEWKQLTYYVGFFSDYLCSNANLYNRKPIAKALASVSYWPDISTCSDTCLVACNTSTNNITGFSAIPAGYFSPCAFFSVGHESGFWSTTEIYSSAYHRSLMSGSPCVDDMSAPKANAYSVRCLRD
ncbi:MAG: FISUMP domain-containing protein [Bacteroidales bacterium]|nr:FISUMP domain-containing protein [Bacteroidales bacterium]MDY6347656.1 FISUMP domain-containing protein [Bacteroidales bacterium]